MADYRAVPAGIAQRNLNRGNPSHPHSRPHQPLQFLRQTADFTAIQHDDGTAPRRRRPRRLSVFIPVRGLWATGGCSSPPKP